MPKHAVSMGILAGGVIAGLGGAALLELSIAASVVAGGATSWLLGVAGSLVPTEEQPAPPGNGTVVPITRAAGSPPTRRGADARHRRHRVRGGRKTPLGSTAGQPAPRPRPVPSSANGTPVRVPANDAWTMFEREIDRSRRYERPVTLIRLPQTRTSGRFDPDRVAPWLSARLHQLQPVIRSTDVAWFDDTALYVMLPETDRDCGQVFLDRLRSELPSLLPQPSARIAAFPTDGLTVGSLCAMLNESPRRVRA